MNKIDSKCAEFDFMTIYLYLSHQKNIIFEFQCCQIRICHNSDEWRCCQHRNGSAESNRHLNDFARQQQFHLSCLSKCGVRSFAYHRECTAGEFSTTRETD